MHSLMQSIGARESMNLSILVCREDIAALNAAARLAADPAQRNRLLAQSQRHSKRLRELEANVESLGSFTIMQTPWAAGARALWRRIRGIFAWKQARDAFRTQLIR